MKPIYSAFSTRAATLAPVSDRCPPARPAGRRSVTTDIFGAELHSQRQF